MGQMCQTGHTVFRKSCKSCLEIRADWYLQLQINGFKDIENLEEDFVDRNSLAARCTHIDFHTKIQFDAKRSYYQWARDKLIDGKFRSDTDKLIWEYHSEGISTRTISPRVGLNQSWTARKVARIRTYLKDPLAIIGSVSYASA